MSSKSATMETTMGASVKVVQSTAMVEMKLIRSFSRASASMPIWSVGTARHALSIRHERYAKTVSLQKSAVPKTMASIWPQLRRTPWYLEAATRTSVKRLPDPMIATSVMMLSLAIVSSA